MARAHLRASTRHCKHLRCWWAWWRSSRQLAARCCWWQRQKTQRGCTPACARCVRVCVCVPVSVYAQACVCVCVQVCVPMHAFEACLSLNLRKSTMRTRPPHSPPNTCTHLTQQQQQRQPSQAGAFGHATRLPAPGQDGRASLLIHAGGGAGKGAGSRVHFGRGQLAALASRTEGWVRGWRACPPLVRTAECT